MGSFTFKDNCVTAIEFADSDVAITHYMHYYKAPDTHRDAKYSVMMFDAKTIKPFIENIGGGIERKNRNNYWYLSLMEGDCIFFACNTIQGYFKFNTANNTVDYIEVLNEVNAEDAELLERISEIDFTGYSTYIEGYAGIEKNIPSLIVRFATYAGQYVAITEVQQNTLDKNNTTPLKMRIEDIRKEQERNNDF